jgi:Uma2 family endonuclease
MATTTSLMTTEELLALPDDGVYRELIRGELREYPMTTRGYSHSLAMVNLSHLLRSWLERQPRPRGVVIGGEARIRIRRNPDTFVGIDLAYISPDLTSRTPRGARFVDGPPVLAVEILSPSDTQQDILEKVGDYLDAGVALVWVVEPIYGTITVYRVGAKPKLFNEDQEITAEHHLPGFRAPVAEVFAT